MACYGSVIGQDYTEIDVPDIAEAMVGEHCTEVYNYENPNEYSNGQDMVNSFCKENSEEEIY